MLHAAGHTLNERRAAMTEAFYVYVVELDRAGPPSVYVGSSALRPEERFARHKAGGIPTSRYVRRQGTRLRPDLYAHLNPILGSRADARSAERHLRSELRGRGYRVYGSCSPRKDGCFF